MATKREYMKSPLNMDQEIERTISHTVIKWPKTKEELWPALWEKAEQINPVANKGRTIRIKFIRYAAAAVLALLVGLVPAMYFYKKTIDTSFSMTEVVLPDRSSVILSEHSSMSYKPVFWKISRSVKIEGEGLFTVQKGSRFSVVSEKGITSVLGTRFNVFARQNDYEVTCLSGLVKIMEFSRKNEAVIHGGQKAILKPEGNFIIIESEKEIPGLSNPSKSEDLEAELDAVLSGEEEKQVIVKDNIKASADEKIPVKTEINKPSDELQPEQVTSSKEPVEMQHENHPSESSGQAATGEHYQVQNEANKGTSVSSSKNTGDKFRNALSKEQISILEDKSLSREEKKKAFMKSLSTEQRRLLEEQIKERARNAGNENSESEKEKLRELQKKQIQEQICTGKENSEQQRIQDKGGDKKQRDPVNGSGSVDKNNKGNGEGN